MSRILKSYFSNSTNCLRYYSIKHAAKTPIKYTSTINLPKTKFPTRLSAAKRTDIEKSLIAGSFSNAYQYQKDNNQKPAFVLHDGPPYANGDLHMGHSVNKILKDITLRQNVTQGRMVNYKPGWDCHGLPIELKAMSSSKSNPDPLTIRQKSRKFAMETVDKQKEEFRSWGILSDWVNPSNIYLTFSPAFISNQLKMFLDFFNRKIVYRALKPVYWSPSSKTALAEAELEYDPNFVSPSVVLRFKLLDIPPSAEGNNNTYALVWTTTPWTLPSNQAICYNSELEYSLVSLSSDSENQYLLASNLIEEFQNMTGLEVIQIKTISGDSLKSCSYSHPIDDTQKLPFLPAGHVQDTKGTGLVHTAPAHGPEDFLVSLDHKLPVKCFVNENGIYTDEAPSFLSGKSVLGDGDKLVLEHLSKDVIFSGTFAHAYPIDWRTKQPVIIRASEQWFINTEQIRDKAVEEIEKVNVFPRVNSEANKKALITQVKKRPYWCISRQRAWGVPIPVFYDKESGKEIVNEKIIGHICGLLEKEGNIDFWWKKPVEELLSAELLKDLNLKVENLEKGSDIFDIWFDSGSSWSSVLDGDKVAELYLEGYDQFTGWFQSSLLTSIAARGCSPYKSLFVHGFTVDEKGHKMSKSLGNIISPKDITKKYGTDTLRWWVASHGTQHMSITVCDKLLQHCAENLSKIRSTLRYLNGAIGDHSRSTNKIDCENKCLTHLDRYLLSCINQFENEIQKSYDSYEYNRVTANILNFVTNQISSVYVHLVKDRLYCGKNEQIEGVKKVLSNSYEVLCKSLWPIVPFLVEESWSYYDSRPFHEAKVHTNPSWNDPKVEEIIETAFEVKRLLNRHSQDVNTWLLKVNVSCGSDKYALLKNLQPTKTSTNSELCELLQVSSVELVEDPSLSDCTVALSEDGSILCPRCRRFCVNSEDSICERCEQVLQSRN
ncbi:isoleucine--tRNA ligase, mitochondrial [Episyrphus balteatus]|uniref:isoleucine--tRNA ligase, mitochondrial n=1 Tax=Episyrphus balteatus TaxID=286459 RepID=UPI00248566D8|nr:isoleucine--tRNA ligase, mitochondrial [Episyrphus balteatus]